MGHSSTLLEIVVDLHQRIYSTLLASITETWMNFDFTMPQLKVLLCLYINGAYRMGDLASTLGVSTPTITGIIDRLVLRGMVVRTQSAEDRRVVACLLSPKGKDQVSALWMARFAVFHDIFSTLSPAQLDTVASAAEIVLEAAERKNVGTMVKSQYEVSNPRVSTGSSSS
jgi:DNA-binding MarR family transcriptional regulator